MIKIKGEGTSLDWQIINSIKDVSVKNIEFKNITFECETITDASGNLFEKRKKGHWIPCNERLPEEEYVLISKKPKKYFDGGRCVTIAIRMEDPRSRKVNWRDIGFGVIPDDKVLAWMPLPEPYREEGEKDG